MFIRSQRPPAIEISDTIAMTSSKEQSGFTPNQTPSSVPPARSTEAPLGARVSLFSFGLIAVSIYGTSLSGIFLIIAIVEPQYGHHVSERGSISPSAAALLTAFLAKTIELSFVTVYLVFLGQHLSRQAASRGISLGSVSMRSWILQPGKLISDWKIVLMMGSKFLGLSTIFVTVLTLLYTTAANTLVQPQLRVPPSAQMNLVANVSNHFFLSAPDNGSCPGDWPITEETDQLAGITCQTLRLSSSCTDNFARYFARWTQGQVKNRSTTLADRIPISASMDDNTDVTTTWLDRGESTIRTLENGRIVENVTIAIPHPRIRKVIQDPRNSLLQPQDTSNVGSYNITAAVSSATLNCLCANANATEIMPIIYTSWPNALPFNDSFDATQAYNMDWPVVRGLAYSNATVLDHIFGWQNHSEKMEIGRLDDPEAVDAIVHARPTFGTFPPPGSSILNHTSWKGRPTIYVLGQATIPRGQKSEPSSEYYLCAIHAGLTSRCATEYRATLDGANLTAVCDEEAHEMAYNRVNTSAADVPLVRNWKDLAFSASAALSLGDGLRLSVQPLTWTLGLLYLRNGSFSPTLPSPAEALLSMMVCTALDNQGEIPFDFEWVLSPERPYRDYKIAGQPFTRSFAASVQIAQYMSGGKYRYQKGFLVILASVFVINLALLMYLFFLRLRLVVDICEPILLFLLGYHTTSEGLFSRVFDGSVAQKDAKKEWVLEECNGDVVIKGRDGL